MKQLALLLIKIYQTIFASPLVSCRFKPTCSQYAHEAINTYGVLKGGILAIKRIASCHPFSTRSYYDPVSNKKAIIR